MELSEVIKSSAKPYKVKLIATVNPHIFWLEPILGCEFNIKNHQIIQAGLANVFPADIKPTEPIFQIHRYSSTKWIPAGCRLLQNIVSEAGDAYFLPLHVMPDEFSLMENVTCIFGDLFIIEDGILKSVTGLLSEYGVLYKSTKRFQRYLKSGEVFVDLSVAEIDDVIEIAITYANERYASIIQNKHGSSQIHKLVDTYKGELIASLEDKDENENERVLRNMDSVYKMCIEMDKEEHANSKRVLKENPIERKSTTKNHEDDGSNDSEATVTSKAKVSYMPAGANLANFNSTPKTNSKKKKKYYKNSSVDNNCRDTKLNVSNSSIDDSVHPDVTSFIKSVPLNQSQKRRSIDVSSQASSYYDCSDLENSLRSKSLQGEFNSSQSDLGISQDNNMSRDLKLNFHRLSINNQSEIWKPKDTVSAVQNNKEQVPSSHLRKKFLHRKLLSEPPHECADFKSKSKSSSIDGGSSTSAENDSIVYTAADIFDSKRMPSQNREHSPDRDSTVSLASVSMERKLQFFKRTLQNKQDADLQHKCNNSNGTSTASTVSISNKESQNTESKFVKDNNSAKEKNLENPSNLSKLAFLNRKFLATPTSDSPEIKEKINHENNQKIKMASYTEEKRPENPANLTKLAFLNRKFLVTSTIDSSKSEANNQELNTTSEEPKKHKLAFLNRKFLASPTDDYDRPNNEENINLKHNPDLNISQTNLSNSEEKKCSESLPAKSPNVTKLALLNRCFLSIPTNDSSKSEEHKDNEYNPESNVSKTKLDKESHCSEKVRWENSQNVKKIAFLNRKFLANTTKDDSKNEEKSHQENNVELNTESDVPKKQNFVMPLLEDYKESGDIREVDATKLTNGKNVESEIICDVQENIPKTEIKDVSETQIVDKGPTFSPKTSAAATSAGKGFSSKKLDADHDVSVTEKIYISSPESDPNLVSDESETYYKESAAFQNCWSVSNMLRYGVDTSGIKSPFPMYQSLISGIKSPFSMELKDLQKERITTSPIKNDASEIFRNFSSYFVEGDLIDKITSPKIVIHNKSGEICMPMTSLDSAHFLPVILNNLKSLGVKIPSKLQSSVWPMAFSSRSLFVVSSVRTGRGLSVLAPICNKLPKIVLSELPDGVGPIVMIVCPDMFAAAKAFSSCKVLLKDCFTIMGNEFRIVKIDDWNNSDYLYSIVKGVDVLVITSRCLYQFLNYEVSIINLNRLLYLVFEDLDILNERFHDETKRIMDTCQKSRTNTNQQLLVYATSQIWCEFMERLAKKSHNPTVIVGALQECLFYSKPEMNVTFCKADDKLQKLENIFQNAPRTFQRILIMCDGDEEIAQVSNLLRDVFITYVADATTIDVVNDISNMWKSHDLRTGSVIMITYDENLHFLGIEDVHWLIHFSLSKTFARFNFRFSSMAKNFPNLYDLTAKRVQLKVDVIISENDLTRLPKFVSYISRFNMDISGDIVDLLKDVIKLQDIIKADTSVPLCERFSAFGYCSNTWNCIERHSLVASDHPSEWFPKSGRVKCRVIFVQHASLFSARLIEYVDLVGSKHSIAQKHILMLFELGTYFSSEGNRQCHRFVKCGDICAVKVLNDYKRCQVLRIIPTSTTHSTDIIRINLIDEERYIDVKRNELLHLPSHLKDLCPTVVKVRLAGIVPSDDDNFWSATAIEHVKTLLNTESDIFVQGNIVLGIGNTLWLDDIQVSRHLETVNIDIVKCNLKENLISKKLAVENPNHLEVLYGFCKTFNFDLPHFDKPLLKVTNKKSVEPQWAYLYDDLTNIYFSYAESLSLFYVRHEKFDKLLTNLEDDLQIYVKKLKENPVKTDLNINDKKIQQGCYCVALFIDDGAYYRAKILRALDGQDKLIVYECFFVDHGEKRTIRVEDIYPLSEDLLTRLPFQAIECRIFGVKPIEDNWQDTEVDKLYDFCFIGDSDESKVLLCKFYAKEKSEYTRNHKYAIILIDPCQTSFTDFIIESKLALPVAQELELIQKDADNIKQLFQANTRDCEDMDKSDDDTSEILDIVEWSDEEVDDRWDCEFYKEHYESLLVKDHLPRLCSLPEKREFKQQNYDDIKKNVPLISNKNQTMYQTPRILWHQTREHVTVKIMLPDVNIYECEIGPRSLYFETNIEHIRYKLDIELAACVKQEKSYHVTKGMYVFIRIYKHIAVDWETLIAPNAIANSKLIVYDPDFLFVEDDPDSDGEGKLFKEAVKGKIREMNNDELADSDEDPCEDVKTLEIMEKDPINRKIMRMLKEQTEEETDESDECDE